MNQDTRAGDGLNGTLRGNGSDGDIVDQIYIRTGSKKGIG